MSRAHARARCGRLPRRTRSAARWRCRAARAQDRSRRASTFRPIPITAQPSCGRDSIRMPASFRSADPDVVGPLDPASDGRDRLAALAHGERHRQRQQLERVRGEAAVRPKTIDSVSAEAARRRPRSSLAASSGGLLLRDHDRPARGVRRRERAGLIVRRAGDVEMHERAAERTARARAGGAAGARSSLRVRAAGSSPATRPGARASPPRCRAIHGERDASVRVHVRDQRAVSGHRRRSARRRPRAARSRTRRSKAAPRARGRPPRCRRDRVQLDVAEAVDVEHVRGHLSARRLRTRQLEPHELLARERVPTRVSSDAPSASRAATGANTLGRETSPRRAPAGRETLRGRRPRSTPPERSNASDSSPLSGPTRQPAVAAPQRDGAPLRSPRPDRRSRGERPAACNGSVLRRTRRRRARVMWRQARGRCRSRRRPARSAGSPRGRRRRTRPRGRSRTGR